MNQSVKTFLPELHRCGGGEFVERYRQQAGQHGKASLYCKTTVSVCLCVQFEILCSLFLRVSLRATELIPNFKIDECKKLFASLLKGEQRLLTWTHTLTHTHTHSHTHTHTHTHSYLMHNVHSKVFPAICGVHSKQDKDLVHRCHALRPHLTPTRVGVPSDYNCQYTKTLAHLNKMDGSWNHLWRSCMDCKMQWLVVYRGRLIITTYCILCSGEN